MVKPRSDDDKAPIDAGGKLPPTDVGPQGDADLADALAGLDTTVEQSSEAKSVSTKELKLRRELEKKISDAMDEARSQARFLRERSENIFEKYRENFQKLESDADKLLEDLKATELSEDKKDVQDKVKKFEQKTTSIKKRIGTLVGRAETAYEKYIVSVKGEKTIDKELEGILHPAKKEPVKTEPTKKEEPVKAEPVKNEEVFIFEEGILKAPDFSIDLSELKKSDKYEIEKEPKGSLYIENKKDNTQWIRVKLSGDGKFIRIMTPTEQGSYPAESAKKVLAGIFPELRPSIVTKEPPKAVKKDILPPKPEPAEKPAETPVSKPEPSEKIGMESSEYPEITKEDVERIIAFFEEMATDGGTGDYEKMANNLRRRAPNGVFESTAKKEERSKIVGQIFQANLKDALKYLKYITEGGSSNNIFRKNIEDASKRLKLHTDFSTSEGAAIADIKKEMEKWTRRSDMLKELLLLLEKIAPREPEAISVGEAGPAISKSPEPVLAEAAPVTKDKDDAEISKEIKIKEEEAEEVRRAEEQVKLKKKEEEEKKEKETAATPPPETVPADESKVIIDPEYEAAVESSPETAPESAGGTPEKKKKKSLREWAKEKSEWAKEKGQAAWETVRDRETQKVALDVAYKTAASIGGVKFATDLLLAVPGLIDEKWGLGDIHKRRISAKKMAEEKKEIMSAYQDWAAKAERYGVAAAEESGVAEALADESASWAELETKILASEHLKPENRQALLNSLQKAKVEFETAVEKAEQKRNEKAKKLLDTFMQNKVSGYLIAKDAFNTALTASGLAMIRGGVYGAAAIAERMQKANREFSVKRETAKAEGAEFTESKIKYISKYLTIDALKETGRALWGRGIKKGETGKKQKFLDRIKAAGMVARCLGIGYLAYKGAMPAEAIDNLIKSVGEHGITATVQENFAENLSRSSFGAMGHGKEVPGAEFAPGKGEFTPGKGDFTQSQHAGAAAVPEAAPSPEQAHLADYKIDTVGKSHEEIVGVAAKITELEKAGLPHDSIEKLPLGMITPEQLSFVEKFSVATHGDPAAMDVLAHSVRTLHSPEDVYNSMLVHKGDGLERVLQRQLLLDPEAHGYKGDLADAAAVHKWAGHEASVIAQKQGLDDKYFVFKGKEDQTAIITNDEQGKPHVEILGKLYHEHPRMAATGTAEHPVEVRAVYDIRTGGPKYMTDAEQAEYQILDNRGDYAGAVDLMMAAKAHGPVYELPNGNERHADAFSFVETAAAVQGTAAAEAATATAHGTAAAEPAAAVEPSAFGQGYKAASESAEEAVKAAPAETVTGKGGFAAGYMNEPKEQPEMPSASKGAGNFAKGYLDASHVAESSVLNPDNPVWKTSLAKAEFHYGADGHVHGYDISKENYYYQSHANIIRDFKEKYLADPDTTFPNKQARQDFENLALEAETKRSLDDSGMNGSPESNLMGDTIRQAAQQLAADTGKPPKELFRWTFNRQYGV